MKDNANPVFDERFEYSVAPNELTQKTLQVSVINKKGFFHMQRSPVLGQVRLINEFQRNFFLSYYIRLPKNTTKLWL